MLFCLVSFHPIPFPFLSFPFISPHFYLSSFSFDLIFSHFIHLSFLPVLSLSLAFLSYIQLNTTQTFNEQQSAARHDTTSHITSIPPPFHSDPIPPSQLTYLITDLSFIIHYSSSFIHRLFLFSNSFHFSFPLGAKNAFMTIFPPPSLSSFSFSFISYSYELGKKDFFF